MLYVLEITIRYSAKVGWMGRLDILERLEYGDNIMPPDLVADLASFAVAHVVQVELSAALGVYNWKCTY